MWGLRHLEKQAQGLKQYVKGLKAICYKDILQFYIKTDWTDELIYIKKKDAKI